MSSLLLHLALLWSTLVNGLSIDGHHGVASVRSDAERLFFFRRPATTPASSGSNSRELLLNFSQCAYERADLKRIVHSVNRILEFFDKHIDSLVLDAAVGTRILESQLMLILVSHPELPQPAQMYLMALQYKSEILSDEILDKFTGILLANDVTTKESASLTRQLPWVQNASLWESPYLNEEWEPHESLSKIHGGGRPLLNATGSEAMDEETSDSCISNLFTTCQVSEPCAKLFMTSPHSMYSLTHQVIFFLIAKKRRCFGREGFRSKVESGRPEWFMQLLCQRVWWEAAEIENSGFPAQFRDLLAEQISVCSLAGYPNFLKRSWLERIFSWQNGEGEEGCFLSSSGGNTTSPNKSEVMEDMPTEGYQTVVHRVNSKLTKADFSDRVKRADEVVQVGSTKCSVHFSAVSLAALAMHLRYFADTCLRPY